jgi:positive regulator of sigma E activity
VALLLGFTFFMGLMLTPLLSRILGFSNGGFLIMTAFGGTAAVFAVLAHRHRVQARFLGHGQLAVRRRGDPAGVDRQHLPAFQRWRS